MVAFMVFSLGLIPARAGNTAIVGTANQIVGAHPRSRGEHMNVQFSPGGLTGSSPLARGTLTPITGDTCAFGLIPARAGNTFLMWRS